MLQEVISLVKGSLKRRCVASCKKKLPRVTRPLVVLMFAGDTQVVNDNVSLALDWNGKSDNRVLESKNIVSIILRIF